MRRYNPNWFARIYRNEIPDVIVNVETPPEVVVETRAPDAGEVLQAAQELVTLTQRQDNGEFEGLYRRLDELNTKMDGIIAAQMATLAAATPDPETVEELAEEIAEEVVSELPTEPIPETVVVAPTVEAPEQKKQRKRGFF